MECYVMSECPDIFVSMYVDKEGNKFIGDEWIASTAEQYEEAISKEMKVFNEVPALEKIVILTPIETLLKEAKGN